jgi:adenylate cyclase
VPGRVIESLLENREKLDTVTEPVYSVCLATDADRFSALAESMHPVQLARFLNQYFHVVSADHRQRETDTVGDAVPAVGPVQKPIALHVKATELR